MCVPVIFGKETTGEMFLLNRQYKSRYKDGGRRRTFNLVQSDIRDVGKTMTNELHQATRYQRTVVVSKI